MINKFVKYLEVEKRMSNHTVIAYEKDISLFLDFAIIESDFDLKEINYQNVRAWIVQLIEEGNSSRTVNRKLSSLRTFFKWAKRMSLIEIDPMLRIKGPKQEKRIPEFVKEEELMEENLETLFSNDFFGWRDRLLIEVLYQTGIRLSELINIQSNAIQNNSIKVLGKRNKERIIPITKELNDQIEDYLKSEQYKAYNSNYLFLTDKGRKMYPNFVYRKVKHYLSLITNLKKRSPHILRHTFATHMLNNGAGLEVLKELLGHADLSATQIYTHNSFEQIHKIYKQAHPRGTD